MGGRGEEVGRESRLNVTSTTANVCDACTVNSLALFRGFDSASHSYRWCRDQLRRRRQRAAAAAAARLSANARDVASRRACAGGAFHSSLQRPARLRRFGEAGRRRAATSTIRSARWRSTRSRSCARSASRVSGSPATIAAGASRIGWPRSSATRSSAWRCSTSRRRAPCTAARPGVRHRVLPLVLPDPAVRSARAADRRRSAATICTARSAAGRDGSVASSIRARSPNTSAASAIPRRSTRRARTIARRPRSISSTTRPMRQRGRMSAARSLGRRRRRPSAVRSDRRLAQRCPRCSRQSACRPDIFSPKRRPDETLAELLGFLQRSVNAPSCSGARHIGQRLICYNCRLGQVAQLVEQRTENPCVGGSIPPLATRF